MNLLQDRSQTDKEISAIKVNWSHNAWHALLLLCYTTERDAVRASEALAASFSSFSVISVGGFTALATAQCEAYWFGSSVCGSFVMDDFQSLKLIIDSGNQF